MKDNTLQFIVTSLKFSLMLLILVMYVDFKETSVTLVLLPSVQTIDQTPVDTRINSAFSVEGLVTLMEIVIENMFSPTIMAIIIHQTIFLLNP